MTHGMGDNLRTHGMESPMQIKKRRFEGAIKGLPKGKAVWADTALSKILNSSSRIHFNWFNRIHF